MPKEKFTYKFKLEELKINVALKEAVKQYLERIKNDREIILN